MNQQTHTSGDCLIRIAREEDIVPLSGLLRDCIEDMRAHGIGQWDEVYPARSTLLADVQSGTLYLASLQTQPVVDSLVLNDHQDPEYFEVAWRIDGVPIAVVH